MAILISFAYVFLVCISFYVTALQMDVGENDTTTSLTPPRALVRFGDAMAEKIVLSPPSFVKNATANNNFVDGYGTARALPFDTYDSLTPWWRRKFPDLSNKNAIVWTNPSPSSSSSNPWVGSMPDRRERFFEAANNNNMIGQQAISSFQTKNHPSVTHVDQQQQQREINARQFLQQQAQLLAAKTAESLQQRNKGQNAFSFPLPSTTSTTTPVPMNDQQIIQPRSKNIRIKIKRRQAGGQLGVYQQQAQQQSQDPNDFVILLSDDATAATTTASTTSTATPLTDAMPAISTVLLSTTTTAAPSASFLSFGQQQANDNQNNNSNSSVQSINISIQQLEQQQQAVLDNIRRKSKNNNSINVSPSQQITNTQISSSSEVVHAIPEQNVANSMQMSTGSSGAATMSSEVSVADNNGAGYFMSAPPMSVSGGYAGAADLSSVPYGCANNGPATDEVLLNAEEEGDAKLDDNLANALKNFINTVQSASSATNVAADLSGNNAPTDGDESDEDRDSDKLGHPVPNTPENKQHPKKLPTSAYGNSQSSYKVVNTDMDDDDAAPSAALQAWRQNRMLKLRRRPRNGGGIRWITSEQPSAAGNNGRMPPSDSLSSDSSYRSPKRFGKMEDDAATDQSAMAVDIAHGAKTVRQNDYVTSDAKDDPQLAGLQSIISTIVNSLTKSPGTAQASSYEADSLPSESSADTPNQGASLYGAKQRQRPHRPPLRPGYHMWWKKQEGKTRDGKGKWGSGVWSVAGVADGTNEHDDADDGEQDNFRGRHVYGWKRRSHTVTTEPAVVMSKTVEQEPTKTETSTSNAAPSENDEALFDADARDQQPSAEYGSAKPNRVDSRSLVVILNALTQAVRLSKSPATPELRAASAHTGDMADDMASSSLPHTNMAYGAEQGNSDGYASDAEATPSISRAYSSKGPWKKFRKQQQPWKASTYT